MKDARDARRTVSSFHTAERWCRSSLEYLRWPATSGEVAGAALDLTGVGGMPWRRRRGDSPSSVARGIHVLGKDCYCRGNGGADDGAGNHRYRWWRPLEMNHFRFNRHSFTETDPCSFLVAVIRGSTISGWDTFRVGFALSTIG